MRCYSQCALVAVFVILVRTPYVLLQDFDWRRFRLRTDVDGFFVLEQMDLTSIYLMSRCIGGCCMNCFAWKFAKSGHSMVMS